MTMSLSQLLSLLLLICLQAPGQDPEAPALATQLEARGALQSAAVRMLAPGSE